MKAAVLCLLLVSCAASQPIPDAGEVSPPTAALLGSIDHTVIRTFAQLKAQAEAGRDPLVLKITSDGGDIFLGMQFIQRVEDLKKRHGVKLVCYGDAFVFSMGFVILQSELCDKRFATKRTVFLAHLAVRSPPSPLTSDQAAKNLENLKCGADRAMAEVIAPRMRMTVEQVLAKLGNNHDWVMSADEALAAHALDGIVDPLIVPPADV
jgi:ATP-dependent protease ClpP protease subunit